MSDVGDTEYTCISDRQRCEEGMRDQSGGLRHVAVALATHSKKLTWGLVAG